MTWSEADRDLLDVVDRKIGGAPRSKQVRVGPSGLGEPCPRALLAMLAGVREEREPYGMWKAAAGTAIHAYLAEAMLADNKAAGRTRWLAETWLTVGHYAGVEVRGTADLYDVDEAVVYDWKTCSATRLKAYRANGPGARYEAQAALYGAGFARLGLTPREVGIVFLPRDGELSAAHVWRAPWDADLAAATLSRAGVLHDELVAAVGDPVVAGAVYPPCGQRYCSACAAARLLPSMFD